MFIDIRQTNPQNFEIRQTPENQLIITGNLKTLKTCEVRKLVLY